MRFRYDVSSSTLVTIPASRAARSSTMVASVTRKRLLSIRVFPLAAVLPSFRSLLARGGEALLHAEVSLCLATNGFAGVNQYAPGTRFSTSQKVHVFRESFSDALRYFDSC